MKDKRIQIKPFDMISILEFNGYQEVNNHSYVNVKGIIRSAMKDEYIEKATKEDWVQITVYDENNEESTFFNGVLTEFQIQSEGNVCIVYLTIYSGTKLMDYEKHIRSFQKKNYTYRQVVDLCNRNFLSAGTIMTEGKGEKLPGFILQYEETDWIFLKRLASYINTVLVPSCRVKGEKYFFGLPEKNISKEFDTSSFIIRQEIEDYSRRKIVGLELTKKDSMSYLVNSRNIYELGDRVSFLDRTLYISKIETVFIGGELQHTYCLKSKKGLQTIQKYNDEFIGLSLMGNILEVDGEKVQIAINDDENDESGSRWFKFSTVYSSPEGAGWYCMPEIGDRIRLYLPTENEDSAYVTSAVHEKEGSGIRTNPDNKIWRNKEGKEIRLTPDSILLTNNKGMSIELSDQSGIKISSNASVTINADGNINICSSNASVELEASNKIKFKQEGTTMELSDKIRVSGSKINLQ